jgi:hypothetical protein
MAFVVALTALLIAIQLRSLRWATQEAASAYMDATSTKVLRRLQGELSTRPGQHGTVMIFDQAGSLTGGDQQLGLDQRFQGNVFVAGL